MGLKATRQDYKKVKNIRYYCEHPDHTGINCPPDGAYEIIAEEINDESIVQYLCENHYKELPIK